MFDNFCIFLKKIFNGRKGRVFNDTNVNDLEFVELLIEKNITQNNRKNNIINEDNELNNLDSIFQMYIGDIFQDNDYITIKNDDKYSIDTNISIEKVYKNETEKIIQYILDYKIIIRNKSFSGLLTSIKNFNSYEKERIKFIQKIKEMNVKTILENIDNQFVKEYSRGNNKIFVNLLSCGIPSLNSYNYLMTFEREKCKIVIESNNIFVYYTQNNNNTYKFELNYDYYNIKYVFYLVKNDYVKYMKHIISNPSISDVTYNLALYKDNGFFSHVLFIENRYLEDIFKYHNVNIFLELKKKYKNYKFNTFLHHPNLLNYYLVME